MDIFTISTAWNFFISILLYGLGVMLLCFFYILFMDWWHFTDELALKYKAHKEKLRQKLLVDNDEE